MPRKPDAEITVRRKHSLAVRWMHWLNFPLLGVMIWSGLMIYWADTHPGQNPGQYYRIGVGNWTLWRLFPAGFYEHLKLSGQLAKGLSYHFAFMWLFALNGFAYVLYLAFSGEWRLFVPEKRSFRDAWFVVLKDLHIRKDAPEQIKYNGAQRIAYAGVVVLGAAALVTGLAIYKPVQLGFLTRILGGYEMARWFHFWITWSFVGFFVIHIVQVVIAGWNNFQSMVTGVEKVESAPVPLSPPPEPALPPAKPELANDESPVPAGSIAEPEPLSEEKEEVVTQ